MTKYGMVAKIEGKEVNIPFEYKGSDDKREDKRNRDRAIRQIKVDFKQRINNNV